MTQPPTPSERTVQLLHLQADACRSLGSPLYADLLHRTADDLLAGGVAAAVLAGHLDDPGPSALALRMMGGVHALVLQGRAPGLAAYFPSVGGDADPGPGGESAWAALADLLGSAREEIREWLRRAPQTNEVGRGAALAGGLRHVVAQQALPVRLVEVGASAGLNLRADRFRIDGQSGAHGAVDSPVQLAGAWQGHAPPEATVEVVSRVGGDLAPIDPLTDAGRLALTAYVWADQVDRLARLRGALQLAAEVPAELRQEPAAETVGATSLVDGSWTVVWHSVFRQYLDATQKRDLDDRFTALGATATPDRRLARLTLEPERRSPGHPHEFLVTLTTWPCGERRVLGTAAPHGIPTVWET